MATHHSPLRRLLGLVPLLGLLAACGEPPPPPVARVSSLPPGELILLGAGLAGPQEAHSFYLVDPTSGALSAWELQGGRGISEGGSTCFNLADQQRWDAGRRQLVYSASLGCAQGLYHISADGAVAQQTLAPLPAAVENQRLHISAPDGGVAVVGTIYQTPSPSSDYLYVAQPGGGWAVYGEGMGFEQINHLRWSPDSRSLAFIADTRPGGVYERRAYRVDLDSGELYALSQDQALIDAVPAFAPDGSVVFAGAAAEGAPPAIYWADPGAEAFPIVDLGGVPGAEFWRGALTLSPDGRLAAFSGERANPTTASTVYAADLESGELRDLLPGDQADERSGDSPEGAPAIEPLAWSPDSQQLLVVAEFAGVCSTQPMTGGVSCTSQLYRLPASGGAPTRLGDAELNGASFAIWAE